MVGGGRKWRSPPILYAKTAKKLKKKTFLEKFRKSPLRILFLGVYSYLSLAMSLATTTAGSLLGENVERKRK